MEPARPVSELMTHEVATTRPDAKLAEAGRVMRELHVSGLPVLGPDERVVGVLSEKDLVRKLNLSSGVSSPRGVLDLLFDSAPARGPSLIDLCRRRLENAQVREAMSSPAITILPTATTRDAARAMLRWHVHRLPVVDGSGRLLGVVTRADLVSSLVHPPTRRRGRLHPQSRRTPRKTPDPYGDA